MATVVAKTSHVSPVMTVQEKGSRNKRKFRADPSPPIGSQKMVSTSQAECFSYEFSAEKFECHGQDNACDMCSFGLENTDSVKLDLGLSCADFGANRNRVELDANDGFHDADWSDLTESELEELVLVNLDTMFKSAVKKIVACGYTEEVAIKGILRSGLCCGCQDIVSSMVENTLIFLKNGQDVDPWKEHQFENLEQMEKYLLAELVCVVREIRPSFSTGDAMWCLLISDMNVSQACGVDGDELCTLSGDGSSNSVETRVSVQSPCKVNHSVHDCTSDPPAKTEVRSKPKSSFVLDGFASQKGDKNSSTRMTTRSFSLSSHEEKPIGSRKINGISKRDYLLRQKSVQLEKSYRTHGLKGVSRSGKLGNIGGLILDKKLKSVSESTSISLKNASLKINDINNNSAITPPALSVAETELSLSLPVKRNNPPPPEAPALSFSAMRYDKSFGRWTPQDKKEETISKLAPRVHDLQNQLQLWTEWANQKVMQAARRLGKDKAELKTLRQEKDEVDRLKKKRTLMQLQFWEKQKTLFQEELITERRKLTQLKEDLEQAKEQRDQLETKWKQEEKAKQELINQAVKIKIERQEGEVSAKSREDLTRLKADKTLQKYKDDIQKLEKEISLLRLKSDSSKIAALRRGVDGIGSYASKLSDVSVTQTHTPYVPETVTDTVSKTVTGGVKRERECVMCLSEEMSVVFLPCAHQVVCTKCNELHEKQGMKDCPSCRGPIQQRVSVRYARS
ncbi:putative transcription factor C2H2 family [Helianthus annuus]|nr:putative transcription factor C2H2 family [Helianthus annuus]KAJ0553829.1 putative transcription factor C2H2 family [Helianthus annuus]